MTGEVRTKDEDWEETLACWNEVRPIARGRGRRLNLLGRTFWRLTVKASTGRRTRSGSAIWSCVCVCGGCKEVSTDNLMKGKVKSCGCLRRQALSMPSG